MPKEKDLHYFITRIINPDLNWIVVSLRSEHKVVYGRIGYTGVKWVDKTPLDRIADRLEEWRDNLWYKYKKDFPENGEAILDEYFRILLDAELVFYDSGEKSVVQGLWELAERMGAYLDLREYVESKKAEVKNKVEEISKTPRLPSEPENSAYVDEWEGGKTIRSSLPEKARAKDNERGAESNESKKAKKKSGESRFSRFFRRFRRGVGVWLLVIFVIMYVSAFVSPLVLEFKTPPGQDMMWVVGNPKPVYIYDIDSSCSQGDASVIRSSLEYLSKETGVRFFEVPHPIGLLVGGISYYCVPPESYNAIGEAESGEAGVSLFVIAWNKVRIPHEHLNREVVLHETLHTMGFGHSTNPRSVMYPYATGVQSLGNDLKEFISKYYSSPLAYINVIPLNLLLLLIVGTLLLVK